MGAVEFSVYQAGADLGEAFGEAKDAALDERDCRGTIAGKHSAVVLVDEPVTLEAAYLLAAQYRESDAQGVGDKWGPAGAIAVRGGERLVQVELVEREGGFADLGEAVRYTLAERGLLREGESVQRGVQGMTNNDARGRVVSGEAGVPVAGATGPEQTGWLFFGVAGI